MMKERTIQSAKEICGNCNFWIENVKGKSKEQLEQDPKKVDAIRKKCAKCRDIYKGDIAIDVADQEVKVIERKTEPKEPKKPKKRGKSRHSYTKKYGQVVMHLRSKGYTYEEIKEATGLCLATVTKILKEKATEFENTYGVKPNSKFITEKLFEYWENASD